MLLKGPVKIEKLGIALLIIEINGDSSKNYFGEVLMIESNLEWAEQWSEVRSEEIILSSLAMKVNKKANMKINQMYRMLGRIE